ncbi:hypothetical protein D3OALGB2SA_3556 [Olavius algarvensis associated proteobacterium Delta 3]|nr:hypothetical protein D3OALGB2SA_3556 [Olavius algarvensis associated proteobacterium Delta 3]
MYRIFYILRVKDPKIEKYIITSACNMFIPIWRGFYEKRFGLESIQQLCPTKMGGLTMFPCRAPVTNTLKNAPINKTKFGVIDYSVTHT